MQSFDIPAPEEAGQKQPVHKKQVWLVFGILVLLGLIIAAFLFLLPPDSFPTSHLITIPTDASVSEMGAELHARGAIRSPLLFKLYARVTMQDRSLSSGMYVFEKPLGLAALTYRLAHNRHGIEPVRITFTEGMTVSDMARALTRDMPDFNTVEFEERASTSEGYLFPDTYLFMPGTTPTDVMTRLSDRFEERISEIDTERAASGRTLEDVVIMASLLEREAKTPEDMRIVAGILWKRLDQDMLLQVDAPFGYLHDENGYTPTAEDLERDSPYNTYLYLGFPPTAIVNPGMQALTAAVTPTETQYLYYLTGKDGLMHYGRTFEEHKRNRELYLD